ncbi:MAG TPA: hypothetical protein DD405_03440 [Desulfobacteraceae bacterium]|nr:hypothetical protein [Desulfobacteraceae bacterium]
MELNKMINTDYIKKSQKGFTIVELLIAIAISSVVMAGIYAVFESQKRTYLTQEEVVEMQQNLRAGIDMMADEIRMAGYDPNDIEGLGIDDIAPRDINNNADAAITGNGFIKLSSDRNGDGILADTEKISFSIYDFPVIAPDGTLDLGRTIGGGGRQPLAQNIEAMGFAFAFDADGNGDLDTDAGGNIIWASDSDGDNDLDINLDTDGDGDIDAADGPGIGNTGLIGGQALGTDVVPDDIRAVRIYLLAKSGRRDSTIVNNFTYVVGHKVINPLTDADPANNNLRMRLLVTTVKCRNLELN